MTRRIVVAKPFLLLFARKMEKLQPATRPVVAKNAMIRASVVRAMPVVVHKTTRKQPQVARVPVPQASNGSHQAAQQIDVVSVPWPPLAKKGERARDRIAIVVAKNAMIRDCVALGKSAAVHRTTHKQPPMAPVSASPVTHGCRPTHKTIGDARKSNLPPVRKTEKLLHRPQIVVAKNAMMPVFVVLETVVVQRLTLPKSMPMARVLVWLVTNAFRLVIPKMSGASKRPKRDCLVA